MRLDRTLGITDAWLAPFDVTLGLLMDARPPETRAPVPATPSKTGGAAVGINAQALLDQYMLTGKTES
jgi:hypothetical protein